MESIQTNTREPESQRKIKENMDSESYCGEEEGEIAKFREVWKRTSK